VGLPNCYFIKQIESLCTEINNRNDRYSCIEECFRMKELATKQTHSKIEECFTLNWVQGSTFPSQIVFVMVILLHSLFFSQFHMTLPINDSLSQFLVFTMLHLPPFLLTVQTISIFHVQCLCFYVPESASRLPVWVLED
jgi:hypothetical protein